MIQRFIEKSILEKLEPGKVVVIYGPRQVGKTTLINAIAAKENFKTLILNGEDRFAREWLSSESIEIFRQNIADNELLIIDEAQQVSKIGLNLKLIVDSVPGIRLIATGSSAFDLANQVGEPLVGRKWQFNLFPISQLELSKNENFLQTKANLSQRLIFGSYPEIVTSVSLVRKIELLNSIVDNALFRDILMLENIRKSEKLLDLLKLLAFQIGNDVSISELANALNINFNTVERYLELLEKTFVIVKVSGFNRNLRKEITKNHRYYFCDNGIRNAIINNFNDLSLRDDVGALWENYLLTERIKFRNYNKLFANQYFWRTYDQKEIDLIEEREGKLFAYEFRWNEKKLKFPKEFTETYKNSEVTIINRQNYLEFISQSLN